jgi:hypothetical protein
MALSAFEDKGKKPEAKELDRVLGASAALWKQLVDDIGRSHPPIAEVWNFAGTKSGWSLRLKRKDRVVLHMTPQSGHFLVGIVLGDKAAKAAHGGGLPAAVVGLIDSAPRYAEGRGIRLPVVSPEDLHAAEKLAAIKMVS